MRKDARAMANYNKMTESKFKAIKILLNGGATVKEAAEYMKVSTAVVYMVNKSETLEEYQAYGAERETKRKQTAAMKAKQEAARKAAEKVGAVPAAQMIPQVVEHRQNVQIQATHYMETKLDKCIELLTGISNKLAAIVSDLYGVKEDAKQDH